MTPTSYTTPDIVRTKLDETDRALAVLTSYAPFGTAAQFVVETEKFMLVSRHLKLTGTQRVLLRGTATLRIT